MMISLRDIQLEELRKLQQKILFTNLKWLNRLLKKKLIQEEVLSSTLSTSMNKL
jgi:hypothetical protein